MPPTMQAKGSKRENNVLPRTTDEWVRKIDDIFQGRDLSKRPFESQWYLNIAHFLGYQYVTWNRVANRLEEPKVPSYRVRLVANRIISTVQLALAKLLKSKPILTTVPATTEEEDRNAARIGDKVLESLWRKFDLDIRLQDVMLWTLNASSGYWKIYWNPKAGRRIRVPMDWEGEPIVNEDSGQIPAVGEDGVSPVIKTINLGDLAVETISPFEIQVDPLCKGSTRPRWILHSKIRDLASIRQSYPEKGGEVGPEHDLDTPTAFERRIMSFMSNYAATASTPAEFHEDSAVVKELWWEPTDEYPNGKLVTVANSVVLQNSDWPEEYSEPDASLDLGPFVRFTDIPVPGRYWPLSMVENLIPLQRNYNKNRSQVIENRNLMSKPKWLEPRGANIHQSAITSEPGEVIQYTPIAGAKPEAWTPPPMPNYVFQEQEQTIKDMEESSGIHQVSKGEAPQGVRAGIAIRFLQEMDDTQLGPKIRRLESALARVGTLILRVVQAHYKEKRVLQVVGKNREIEVFDFQGSDLRNNTDVVVQAGSGFPELKSAKQQYILDLYAQGLFGNPNEPQIRSKILRLLELGDVDTGFEEDRLDELWAQQENRLMAEGNLVEPQYFENHIVHKQVHNRYMKTEAFRKLPPDRQQIFMQHDVLTTKMLAPEPPQLIPPQGEGGEEGGKPASESVAAGGNGSQPISGGVPVA